MKYRRFSIDRNEGELVILALSLATDRILELDDKSAYWTYYREQMIILKKKLDEYNWRKDA